MISFNENSDCFYGSYFICSGEKGERLMQASASLGTLPPPLEANKRQ